MAIAHLQLAGGGRLLLASSTDEDVTPIVLNESAEDIQEPIGFVAGDNYLPGVKAGDKA